MITVYCGATSLPQRQERKKDRAKGSGHFFASLRETVLSAAKQKGPPVAERTLHLHR